MAFRESTHIVSYPYYTKYTRPGDKTKFRHIDLNISDAVKNQRGVQMIQGSVSLDQEDSNNCTELLLGFHKHIKEYQKWREGKGIKDSTGYIEGWKDSDWPDEVASKFPDVKWIKQICRAGAVRLSDPRIPHGSTGPATKVRRTVLPWFVKVHDDHQTMENIEMGNYQEVQQAHLNLTMPPTTPSGHGNKYGGTNWPFPGDTPPVYSTAIGKAVNCQVRWDSPAVLCELEKICINSSYDEIRQWIDASRQDAKAALVENWEYTKKIERVAYGSDPGSEVPDRSFFSRDGKHPPRGAEWYKYDGQIDRDTALKRLIELSRVSNEEYAQRRQNGEPLLPKETPFNKFSAGYSSSGSSLTATSQLPSTGRSQGSPMQLDQTPGGEPSRTKGLGIFDQPTPSGATPRVPDTPTRVGSSAQGASSPMGNNDNIGGILSPTRELRLRHNRAPSTAPPTPTKGTKTVKGKEVKK
jgi:hypothetical protein